MYRKISRYTCLLIVALLTSEVSMAKTLELPISFDSKFLTSLLQETVFKNEQGLSVWGDEEGCNDLTLSNPQVIIEFDSLYILTDAKARTGLVVGNRCIKLLRWQGSIKALQQTDVTDPEGLIAFSTIDTELLNRDGERAKISGRLWNLAKDNVHPHLDKLSINLSKAIAEIRTLLPLFFANNALDQSRKMVDSFHLDHLESSTGRLAVVANFDIDILPTNYKPPHEKVLSETEVQQFVDTWERWDAFLGFIIKIAAGKIIESEKREILLEALIEARYALVEVLSNPASPDVDPVKLSFIKTWRQLAPIFRDISINIKGRESLRFFGFIAAADALNAIDALGPITGWDVSVDGLRHLARLLINDPNIDPLEIKPGVDSRLRELFDFGPAIELPEATDKSAEPIYKPANTAPEYPEQSWINWLLPSVSANVTILDINQTTPDRENISIYLPLVNELLLNTVIKTLNSKTLDSDFHQLYRDLVLTTAWQETCWRQYKRRNGKLKTITSSAGALGMMQIMPRVWRGFYDIKSLGNNISYNAAAGSEILHRYLVRYAIRKGEHKRKGGIDNLARASYAAYNGGPSHLKRYRRKSTAKSLKKIDDGFWKKFLQMREGDASVVKQCYPYD